MAIDIVAIALGVLSAAASSVIGSGVTGAAGTVIRMIKDSIIHVLYLEMRHYTVDKEEFVHIHFSRKCTIDPPHAPSRGDYKQYDTLYTITPRHDSKSGSRSCKIYAIGADGSHLPILPKNISIRYMRLGKIWDDDLTTILRRK